MKPDRAWLGFCNGANLPGGSVDSWRKCKHLWLKSQGSSSWQRCSTHEVITALYIVYLSKGIPLRGREVLTITVMKCNTIVNLISDCFPATFTILQKKKLGQLTQEPICYRDCNCCDCGNGTRNVSLAFLPCIHVHSALKVVQLANMIWLAKCLSRCPRLVRIVDNLDFRYLDVEMSGE